MTNREDLLRELVIKKEDKQAQFEKLIEKTRDLFKLDEETKKVYFNSSITLSDRDKILLFLVGKSFMKELKWIEREGATLSEISEALNNKPTTSLTAPLADFRKKGIISKNGAEYFIPYPEIQKCIESIHSDAFSNSAEVIKARKNKRGFKKKEKISKTLDIEKITTTAKEIGITEEQLRTVYQLEQNDMHLIRTIKSDSIRELHLKYSLLIAFAYRAFYGIENLDSSELRSKLADAGCPKLVGLSTSLKEYPNLIIHQRGERGNIYTTYRITQQGIAYVKKFIVEIVE